MTHTMEEKIQMLDDYISQLDESVANKNEVEAEQLRYEIIAVYENEVDGLRRGLDAYSPDRELVSRPYDNISDAKILCAKLKNYKFNLKSGLYKVSQGIDNSVNVIQTTNQEMQSSISITLDQVTYDINSLSGSVLSKEEKEILCGKLATLSAEKNEKSRWEKAQEILKWVADKSVELGKVALPYVLQAILTIPA